MKILSFIMFLLVVTTAHAQDCAGGAVFAGGGCVPPDVAMPNNQPQAPRPPPQKWQDHYGALATDEPKGILGIATNMISENAAKQSAMADCQAKGGGSDCKFQGSYKNECVVLLVGSKFFNTSAGPTLEEAKQSGMQVCAANGNTNCHVYYSGCSLPVRIQ